MPPRSAASCRRAVLLGTVVLGAAVLFAGADEKADPPARPTPPFQVADGFEVELVAGPPLVERPIAASFDERGRLYIAEASGEHLPIVEMAKRQAHFIRRLDAADAAGKFQTGGVFADKLTFPEGVLWHDGAVYTASPPSVWKFEDTTGKGVADRRTAWQTGFNVGHCANEGHGPYAGPDGRIYWAKGGFTEHRLAGADGKEIHGKASHVFRARPDGTGVETVMAGGMDNPVGVAFTPEGDVIFSCTFYTNPHDGLRDALVHAVEGGVYPKVNRIIDGYKRTGDLLPALTHLGPAAPAGLTAYRSGAFGDEYRGNLFSAQFNLHKVQRHVLRPVGSTFESRNEDFLVSTSPDFHPTDVLEDADGSLLVVDTGGWYKICCPTSQIAKPEVTGGIYRIRKKGAARDDDPRGLKLAWDRLDADGLAGLLADPRFAVRERAVGQLGKGGAAVVPILATVVKSGASVEGRRNAVWALTRIDGPAARAAVRVALTDKNESVRQAAVYSAGLFRDKDARPLLVEALAAAPPLRRAAATALGRIGDAAASGPLLAALRPDDDRMLEHALIYALIEIADRPSLERALAGDNPLLRRAALIALDQADNSPLTPKGVVPLLKDADPRIQAAALDVIGNRPTWGKEMVGPLGDWISQKDLPPSVADDARRLLVAFGRDPAVQRFIAEGLAAAETPALGRRVLLEAVAEAPVDPLPPGWADGLRASLKQTDAGVVRQAVAAVRSAPGVRKGTKKPADVPNFGPELRTLGDDAKLPADLRAGALAAAAPNLDRLEGPAFDFLLSCLDAEQPPLLRAAAADAVGLLPLGEEQLVRLTSVVARVGPLELPRLLAAYEKTKSAAVGKPLVAALTKSPSTSGLAVDVLTRTLAGYPDEVRQAAAPLFKQAEEARARQKAHLDELTKELVGGDAPRGRTVFRGVKAACTACHAVAGQGGQVGPDLTKVGAIRTERDLLEAIVFPSASFARGYEPFVVTTKDGQVYSGVIRRETADAIVLATGPTAESRIPRSAIDSVEPGKVSLMPEGFDKQLTRQELADLIAYLRTLK